MHQNQSSPTKASDPRWIALDTVQAARDTLGLRDRDIAVLRGLLSFLPADSWDGPLVVFASNSALQERCGGMDERTLRRRLAHLCEVGLITRQQSPNRKRYPVRDGNGAILFAYGFSLAPLRSALPHLRALGEAAVQQLNEIKLHRHILRDRIYHAVQRGIDCAAASRLLRRNATVSSLRDAILSLERAAQLENITLAQASETKILTDSDGQNDRHNQTSKKETYEEKDEDLTGSEISIETCIERAPNAVAFAERRPSSWHDLDRLAYSLAPAIGLEPYQIKLSQETMGQRGTTLAVLGLVEAYGNIRHPKRYLDAILRQKKTAKLSLVRMFNALTRRFPAGNQLATA